MRKFLLLYFGVLWVPAVWAKDIPKMPLPYESNLPHDRLSIGINYTGGQIRWNLSSRWAAEGRYQEGTSSSNYGDVTARVFGLRGYRFLHPENRVAFYWGAEGAYATAKPVSSSYKVTGLAIGGFGGLEYRVARRISIDADLGPYVISLTEKQTHTSTTNLDFVFNTALLVRLF